jgi:hypothetical protein
MKTSQLGIISQLSSAIYMLFGGDNYQDDDGADRLNYKYTVAILVIFTVIVTNRQFGTKQIRCWIPAHFTSKFFHSFITLN